MVTCPSDLRCYCTATITCWGEGQRSNWGGVRCRPTWRLARTPDEARGTEHKVSGWQLCGWPSGPWTRARRTQYRVVGGGFLVGWMHREVSLYSLLWPATMPAPSSPPLAPPDNKACRQIKEQRSLGCPCVPHCCLSQHPLWAIKQPFVCWFPYKPLRYAQLALLCVWIYVLSAPSLIVWISDLPDIGTIIDGEALSDRNWFLWWFPYLTLNCMQIYACPKVLFCPIKTGPLKTEHKKSVL